MSVGSSSSGALIAAYLPWLLSAITIWMTVLAGNKHPSAWLVGLVNQLLWLIWIILVGAWGLLPMNLALWIVYGRNHLKWNAGQSGRYASQSTDRVVSGLSKDFISRRFMKQE